MMVYVPIRFEIDPITLASAAILVDWEVCVGRGLSRESTLHPVAIDPSFIAGGSWHLDLAAPDAWGMSVPRDHTPVRASTLTAVVVPGLAFDRQGHRLGRGAGVYDRFLSTLPPETLRIGLVPAALLVDELPTDAHDVRMHAIATEQGIVLPR